MVFCWYGIENVTEQGGKSHGAPWWTMRCEEVWSVSDSGLADWPCFAGGSIGVLTI